LRRKNGDTTPYVGRNQGKEKKNTEDSLMRSVARDLGGGEEKSPGGRKDTSNEIKKP